MAEELIVFVDEDNNELGTGPKLASHNSKTRLHRAFSCFVFNAEGKFLLTQRALSKKVFPGVWTNSCCGHTGPGEESEAAVRRRLEFELGLDAHRLVLALPKFTYRAEMGGIVEHEFCPVYLAVTYAKPRPNPDEVETFEWVNWGEFLERAEKRPDSLSLWSVMETAELEQNALFQSFLSELSL